VSKAKGTYYEHRAIKHLEKTGYCCSRAGGSLGVFDIIAFGPTDVRAIQVKGGTRPYLCPAERKALQQIPVSSQVSKELWKYFKHKRAPIIEVL
jgi:Holliday junction resolvase